MRNFGFYRHSNFNGKDPAHIALEEDILINLAGSGKLFALHTSNWWSQVKTAGSAIYANRHYLELYRMKMPERLVPNSNGKCNIIGDVHIHSTASVDSTALVILKKKNIINSIKLIYNFF